MTNNTLILIAGISIIFLAVIYIGYKIYKFLRLTKEQKIEQIKQWLLIAVAEAENMFGSKTGALKLSYVYSLFLSKFPYLARIISAAEFEIIVNEILIEFKSILNNNTEIAKYVIENKIEVK